MQVKVLIDKCLIIKKETIQSCKALHVKFYHGWLCGLSYLLWPESYRSAVRQNTRFKKYLDLSFLTLLSILNLLHMTIAAAIRLLYDHLFKKLLVRNTHNNRTKRSCDTPSRPVNQCESCMIIPKQHCNFPLFSLSTSSIWYLQVPVDVVGLPSFGKLIKISLPLGFIYFISQSKRRSGCVSSEIENGGYRSEVLRMSPGFLAIRKAVAELTTTCERL